jgi:hypothetical protein
MCLCISTVKITEDTILRSDDGYKVSKHVILGHKIESLKMGETWTRI